MSHPFRENLEVWTESNKSWIRCLRCSHLICPMGNDWKQACSKRTFPPTKAGPLMAVLTDRYVLEQHYCPSCGTLLDADIVEQVSEPA
jgi:acetone carboxylase gamma subunit